MKINLSPCRSDEALSVAKAGDVPTINGEAFDFSVIPDGATLPASAVESDFAIGSISREGGSLELTLRMPHGPNPSSAVAFPAALIDPPDGPLDLPSNPEESE